MVRSPTDKACALPVTATDLNARTDVDDTQIDLLNHNMAVNATIGNLRAHAGVPIKAGSFLEVKVHMQQRFLCKPLCVDF
jgi:hypothetical protein